MAHLKRIGARFFGNGSLNKITIVSFLAAVLFVVGSAQVVAAPAPAISLGVSSGTRGTTVSISGQHFDASAAISVSFSSGAYTNSNIASGTITSNNGGAFSGSIVIPAGAPAGLGSVIASDGTSTDATASFTVTVANQATLTVTGLPASAVYQQAGITAGTSGGNGTGAVTFSAGLSSACSVNSTSGAVTILAGTGTCSITATKAGDNNYNSTTSAPVSITVGKATPTATLAVSNSPVTYTGVAQSATVAVSASSVPGSAGSILTGGAASQTNAGTYAVTATFIPADTADYNSVTGISAGNFVINKASLTATADDKTVTYGDADPAFTVSYTGFVNGETAAVLDSAATASVSGAHANATTYSIVPAGGSDGNYSIDTYVNGTLTVAQKALTITAQNQNKYVGSTLSLTGTEFTHSSMIGSESVGSVTLTSAGFGAAAVSGSYSITPSAAVAGAGTDLNNYSISYVDGTLTVNDKLNPVISWSNPADIVYGTALDSTQLSATTTLMIPGSFVYSQPIGTMLSAGLGQNLHVDFTPDDTTVYNSASKDVTINVNPLILTITPDNQTKVYGGAFSFAGTEFTMGTLVSGDSVTSITLTSPATATSSPVSGSPYAITGSNAVGVGLSNYDLHYNTGNFTVTKADQTISFGALGTKTMGDADFAVSATSDSNLSVSFASATSGICTVSGSTVHLVSAGTCTITASQAGDSNYNAAASVQQSFTVAVLTHTITASAGSNGSVTPTGTVVVADASDQAFAITADSGFHIADVTVDGSSVGATSTYNFTGVTADHTISATFAPDVVTPPASATGGGSATFTSPGQVLGVSTGNGQQGTGSANGGQVLGASSFRFNLDLRRGAKNNDVTELQKALSTLDFFKGDTTGYFGPVTLAAVKAYQKAHKIVPVSGFFGPLTRASLNALLGS